MVSDIVFFQAEDGIRDLVRSRGLGDVYKRQTQVFFYHGASDKIAAACALLGGACAKNKPVLVYACLLYTSDAADERSSVDLGGRRIIKKKNSPHHPTTLYSLSKIY